MHEWYDGSRTSRTQGALFSSHFETEIPILILRIWFFIDIYDFSYSEIPILELRIWFFIDIYDFSYSHIETTGRVGAISLVLSSHCSKSLFPND